MIIEQYDKQIDLSKLFLGCRCVGFNLSCQPGQMVLVTYTFEGLDRTPLATGTSPFFDSPTLTSLGLDKPPDTSIILNKQTIAFGIINPATNLRYIRLGESVYTIEDVYYPLLSSNFGTLVSLNLLSKTDRIEKLILVNQTISRNEKGLLQSNIDISADTINKTIDHWQHDQAFGVHEYITREVLGEVFIYIKGQQQPINYLITDTDPWLILARPEIGLEYHLDIEAYDKLIVPQ